MTDLGLCCGSPGTISTLSVNPSTVALTPARKTPVGPAYPLGARSMPLSIGGEILMFQIRTTCQCLVSSHQERSRQGAVCSARHCMLGLNASACGVRRFHLSLTQI